MSNWPEMTASGTDQMCIEIDSLLEGYALGALEPDEMLLVAERIHDCPEQSHRLQTYEETVGLMGLGPESVKTSSHLWDRLQASTTAAESLEPIALNSRRRNVLTLPGWAAGLAAALVLLLLGTTISLGVALRNNDKPDDTFESTMAYYMTSGATVIPLASKSIPEYASWEGKGVLVTMAGMPPLVVVDKCQPARNGSSYVVWLAIDGQRTGMSRITIDEDGRGMMTLDGVDSLADYDMIGISLKTNDDRVYDLIEGPPHQEG